MDNQFVTNKSDASLSVRVIPNDKGNPPGKLADVELLFNDGPLAGLKLQGFGIWETRDGKKRNVTFPARSYTVNGERRSFALLRPIVADEQNGSHARIIAIILEAFAEFERVEAARVG